MYKRSQPRFLVILSLTESLHHPAFANYPPMIMSSPGTDTGSQASHVSDESLASGETNAGYIKSHLWRSLYVLAKSQLAMNNDTVACVPTTNNPCPVRAMGDNTEYWVNVSGEVFTFKFPATLNLEGKEDRSGPYFNLPRTGVSSDFMSLAYETDGRGVLVSWI